MKNANKTVAIPGVFERDRGSGIWWARYTDHKGGKRIEKVGRRSDAIDVRDKRRLETVQRKKLPENFRDDGPTFSELSTDALEHCREENGARSERQLDIKLGFILPEFGGMQASTITKQDVQRWLLDMAAKKGWSNATRNRYQAAFSLVFRIGVDNERIMLNPASKLRRKAENNGRIRFLAAEEEIDLFSVLNDTLPHFTPHVQVSLNTGLRASEQWRLDWGDIDLRRGILTARATKNGDPERHIPLNSVALAALHSIRPTCPQPGEAVFLNTWGYRVHNYRQWWDRVAADAKLDDYSWHCHRHTFASRLVMAGVDLRTVQVLMGHKTIQMTARYSHLAPGHNSAAVEKLVTSLAW